ncbi:MAG TPA: 4Fe-4S ferredoxin [Clostridiales bacterium UBA8153]|nr:4Fe-4S ferredoxin [Clostridiales bacterium UBA8153]
MMPEAALKELAARLLEEGLVDLFIGYGPGSLPLRSTPVFLRQAAGAGGLILGPTCENNLAPYLARFPGERVGLVVKACDARALVELIRENQVNRENLYVVGVPCRGVICRQKLEGRLAGRELTAGRIEGDAVRCGGHEWEEAIPLDQLVHPSCAHCRLPAPELFDVCLGDGEDPVAASGEALEARDARDAGARYREFSREMEKCLLCYACRQACPACYCPECFVDRSQPAWMGGSGDLSDCMLFHLVRALHVAGRCVDCGACARACPQRVDLRVLNRRLEQEARELFGFTPGLDPGHKTLPGSFRPDDPDDFVK